MCQCVLKVRFRVYLAHIRQSKPDIRQSRPDIRQSMPDKRQSRPDLRQSYSLICVLEDTSLTVLYVSNCLKSGLDCLISGIDCLISGLDCLISGFDCLICAKFAEWRRCCGC